MKDDSDTAVSDAERALFRAEIGAIKPVRHNRRALHVPRRSTPRARFSEADEADVITHLLDHPIEPEMLESGEELYYRQRGVQNRVLRQLRRGHYRVAAELDLHGMTVPVARHALQAFLVDCGQRDRRCVRIVHGKGLRSRAKGPVLKHKVDHWLRQRREVMAYCSTPPNDGGTGAVYVLLRYPHY